MPKAKKMDLTQAKRIYKTWKGHPDMLLEAGQATKVIDQFVELAKQIKVLYEEEKNRDNKQKRKSPHGRLRK